MYLSLRICQKKSNRPQQYHTPKRKCDHKQHENSSIVNLSLFSKFVIYYKMLRYLNKLRCERRCEKKLSLLEPFQGFFSPWLFWEEDALVLWEPCQYGQVLGTGILAELGRMCSWWQVAQLYTVPVSISPNSFSVLWAGYSSYLRRRASVASEIPSCPLVVGFGETSHLAVRSDHLHQQDGIVDIAGPLCAVLEDGPCHCLPTGGGVHT